MHWNRAAQKKVLVSRYVKYYVLEKKLNIRSNIYLYMHLLVFLCNCAVSSRCKFCVCLLACSGASWFNFPQDPERKISLVVECGAQHTEHIMLLCLWRQINSCIMEHNKAEKLLMCQDHMAKNPPWNAPADNLRHAPAHRPLNTKAGRI